MKNNVKSFLILSFLTFIISLNGYAETLHGEVRAVNSGSRTVRLAPETTEGLQEEIILKISPDAVLTGVDSFTELEAGDSIRVEVEREDGRVQVQKLDLQEPYGLEPLKATTWSGKLGRGLVNFLTSPVEIPRMIDSVGRHNGPTEAWTVGLIQGVARTFARAGTGLVEVFTFPFDFPDENKAPIFQPEYGWQNWPK